MFWFKNLMVYRLTKSLEWELTQLQQHLEAQRYRPCGKQDSIKFGWIAPLKGSDEFYFNVTPHLLLVAEQEQKLLPPSVIKSSLEEKIAQREQQEQRKLNKTEKQQLKDEVIFELLPRAFSKHSQTALWIDTQHQLIYINSASAKRAEDVLALLRKSLGSLPVVPLQFQLSPTEVMTKWLLQDNLPTWLEILSEAELKNSADNSVLRCKHQDLQANEILSLMNNGKTVTQLSLNWDEHLSFVLQENGSLKRLKFAHALTEENDTIDKEDFAQRFDADFVLMTETLSQLMDKLSQVFGGFHQA